jgi:hypothetical protein
MLSSRKNLVMATDLQFARNVSIVALARGG